MSKTKEKNYRLHPNFAAGYLNQPFEPITPPYAPSSHLNAVSNTGPKRSLSNLGLTSGHSSPGLTSGNPPNPNGNGFTGNGTSFTVTDGTTTQLNGMNYGTITSVGDSYGIGIGETKGHLAVDGEILTAEKIQILDGLKDWQKEIDAKLGILRPNPKLEAEWAELKELRERYEELEKEFTEKNLAWDILKK